MAGNQSVLDAIPIFPHSEKDVSVSSPQSCQQRDQTCRVIALWMERERAGRLNPKSFSESRALYSQYLDPTAPISDRELVMNWQDSSNRSRTAQLTLKIVESNVPVKELKWKHITNLGDHRFNHGHTTFNMKTDHWPEHAPAFEPPQC